MKTGIVAIVLSLLVAVVAIGLYTSESSRADELADQLSQIRSELDEQQQTIEELKQSGRTTEAPDMTAEVQSAIDERIEKLKQSLDLSNFVTEDKISNFVTQEKVSEMRALCN